VPSSLTVLASTADAEHAVPACAPQLSHKKFIDVL
jgi:hypothetical protein